MTIRPVTALAIWLSIFALVAPSPALALRQVGLEEAPNTKAELVQDLTTGRPAVATSARAGAEETVIARFIQALSQTAQYQSSMIARRLRNRWPTRGEAGTPFLVAQRRFAQVRLEAREQFYTAIRRHIETGNIRMIAVDDGGEPIQSTPAGADDIIRAIRERLGARTITEVTLADGTLTVTSVPGLEQPPVQSAGAEERPITVVATGERLTALPAVVPEGSPRVSHQVVTRTDLAEALGQATEILIVDPTHLYYTTPDVGAAVTALVQEAPRRLPGFPANGIEIVPFVPGTEPTAYAIYVKAAGEPVSDEAPLRANHVAIVELAEGMTFTQILQRALAQWTGRPIGQVLGVQQLEDGRLAIYV